MATSEFGPERRLLRGGNMSGIGGKANEPARVSRRGAAVC